VVLGQPLEHVAKEKTLTLATPAVTSLENDAKSVQRVLGPSSLEVLSETLSTQTTHCLEKQVDSPTNLLLHTSRLTRWQRHGTLLRVGDFRRPLGCNKPPHRIKKRSSTWGRHLGKGNLAKCWTDNNDFPCRSIIALLQMNAHPRCR